MKRTQIILTVGCIVSFTAFAESTANPATSLALKTAEKQTKEFASQSRQKAVDLGFNIFKKSVYKEPFEGGVYIVNGDTPIGNDEDLKDFYMKEVVSEWKSTKFGVELSSYSPELIADAPQGKLAIWDNVIKKNLTYCISTSFGLRYQAVVDAIKSATLSWENVSDVHYVHINSLDSTCNASTSDVIFDVRPVNVSGKYLARAFFPRNPREQRNILIDESSFNLAPGKLNLVGILRHELGHTLSYRHEQTRPEAGKCFEDKDWKPLTNYDAFSVMHYPQCNGLGDWSLALTEKDKVGAACLYGPSVGLSFDSAQCSKL